MGWVALLARDERQPRKSPEVCRVLHFIVWIVIPNVLFKVYRGASAKELFLQAFQFILWKQCYTFIHTIGLPAELENVVKNLWALRLQLLKSLVDATLTEETVFSSQLPASESGQENDNTTHRRVVEKAMPSLTDSLGLCYLGMILLRLPVSTGDLHRWATREDVPFIRAIRFVPAIIKEKLPPEYSLILDTTSALEPDQIGKAVRNLGLFYRHHFAINLPPLNAPLLLFKHIKDLALPTILFPVVRHMAALLSMDFSFPEPGRPLQTFSSPETSLISLLIIAVKLYYPFDNLSRCVISVNDCAILQLNWTKWAEAKVSHESRIHAEKHLLRGSEIHVTEEDAMRMSDEKLDDYLDWYERTWIDEHRARHKTRPLDEDFRRWFPTGRQDGSTSAPYDYGEQSKKERQSAQQLSAGVIHAMELRDVVSEEEEKQSEEDVRRVGSHYRRYQSSEDLTTDALAFHEAAANAVGIKLETLLKAVLQVEQRLTSWRTTHLKERGRDRSDREKYSPVQQDVDGIGEADEMETDDTHNRRSHSSSS